MTEHAKDGQPATTPAEREACSELAPTPLPGLVIVSALLAVGFCCAGRTSGGENAALWSLGFILSSLAFLCLFVRLLLERADRSLNPPDPQALNGDARPWSTREQ